MPFLQNFEKEASSRSLVACVACLLLSALFLWPKTEISVVASSIQQEGPTLELLFEGKLQTEGTVKSPVPAEVSIGGFSMKRDLIAQGSGTVHGRLQGTLSWSKLARRLPEEAYAHIHANGWLETTSGDEIFFRINGLSVPVAGKPTLWHDVATVVFEADGDSAWLNQVAAIWSGNFDSRTGQAHYFVYTISEQ